MKNIFFAALLLLSSQAFAAVPEKPEATEKTEPTPLTLSVLGWVEDVIVYPSEMEFSAKLDTGAKTSSIDALNLERFQDLNGKEWVRFTIQNAEGERKTLEKPVLKWVRIKQKGGGYFQRPVVKMALCLGTHYLEGKMNLAKRDEFDNQVLIGRNMLAKNVLVDSAMHNTTKPACEISDEQN